jgi:hypothetical protein
MMATMEASPKWLQEIEMGTNSDLDYYQQLLDNSIRQCGVPTSMLNGIPTTRNYFDPLLTKLAKKIDTHLTGFINDFCQSFWTKPKSLAKVYPAHTPSQLRRSRERAMRWFNTTRETHHVQQMPRLRL